MSAKWIRAKKWDDQHLTGALLPAKFILRTLSGIPLAVVLLTFVSLYGVLASVPIGLIALAPTWAFYALTAVLTVLIGAGVPVWMGSKAMRRAGIGGAPRFVVALLAVVAFAVIAAAAWQAFIWPLVHYRPAVLGGEESHGVRFFADFVDRYQSVQFRRLPMMEMSELEFYSWWPLRIVLLLFVVNMVTATVRRIEFSFVNLGVLTVHTGIVTIALGSIVYSALKQEGDMLLQAGAPSASGEPTPGPPERGFYDNTTVAIWAQQSPLPEGSPGGWEQRPLEWLPRYNDYNLGAAGPGASGFEQHAALRDFGPIAIDVPVASRDIQHRVTADDITLKVIGYSSYATLTSRWVVPPESGETATAGGVPAMNAAPAGGTRLREVEAFLTIPESQGGSQTKPQKTYRFLPDSPAQRVDVLDIFGVEYVRGMDPKRWEELQTRLPRGTKHALFVEHPATGFKSVYPVQAGQRVTVGETGYELEVRSLEPGPPFPIITRGYQNATSSVAIVRVTPPQPEGAEKPVAFERWVYHRFPEISQDMLDTLNERGMPARRDADAALKITYLDASILQVYLDERPSDGSVRAIVRMPGGDATVTDGLKPGDPLEVAPSLRLRLGLRSDNAAMVEAPIAVPPEEQTKSDVGTHKRATVAVQVGLKSDPAFSRVIWLPFSQYMGIGSGTERSVDLPDGRRVTLAFGRVWHQLPFDLRLTNFHMDPYPHSDTPRDYRSDLIVMSRWGGLYQDRARKTSLNEPLLVRVPFIPRDDVPAPVNWAGRLWSFIIPNQYKFSQAGWDAAGWRETKAMADAGRAPRPFARFTILGVGNNPGIYVIAAGAVMMSVGIPWAFYVKPAILRYRKKKIQRELAESGKSRASHTKAGTQGSQRGPGGDGAEAATKLDEVQA